MSSIMYLGLMSSVMYVEFISCIMCSRILSTVNPGFYTQPAQVFKEPEWGFYTQQSKASSSTVNQTKVNDVVVLFLNWC